MEPRYTHNRSEGLTKRRNAGSILQPIASPLTLRPGQLVESIVNLPGATRGSLFDVLSVDPSGVLTVEGVDGIRQLMAGDVRIVPPN